jgi:5-methylthioadenosine/S-adenosylhomocysteine deaminase
MKSENSRKPIQGGGGRLDPDMVIAGGMLLTMVEGEEPLEDVSIFIKDGKILKIQKNGEKPLAGIMGHVEKIDASRGIIMPGLINGHSHAAMTLFRGYADDLPLKEWLFGKIFPLEAQFLSEKTVYWGAMLACMEMIASGTTCFLDGYFFQDGTVRAAHDAGLRALVAQGVIDFPAPGVPDPGENVASAEAFIERWRGFSDLIMPGIFCHSALTCSGRTLQRALEVSSKAGTLLQIHLSETLEEVIAIIEKKGMRPVEYLEDLGLLKQPLIAIHAVHVDDEEITLMGRHGVRVVHAPESNMKLSSGIAPIDKMLKAGVTIGLGTDGSASNNDLDLFLEMDSAAKLGKISSMNPVCLSGGEVLKMAVRGGAAVLGLEREIGTIEVGKRADMIVIDLDAPHLRPLYDPYSTLVYSASGADVKDVIVNGRVLMKDRIFTSLDPDEIKGKVMEISRKIGLQNQEV